MTAVGSLEAAWRQGVAGAAVTIRPRGGSMTGLVPSGAVVVVQPCRAEALEVDDVVLVRVAGSVYLHKVLAVEVSRTRVLIGNNRGRTNGWAAFSKIAGIAVSVDGRRRPRLEGKVRAQP